MFEHFKKYPWVLEICQYATGADLSRDLDAKVIARALAYSTANAKALAAK